MSIAPYEIRTEVPTCAATEALVGLAAALEHRRDLGAGLEGQGYIPSSPAPSGAGPLVGLESL